MPFVAAHPGAYAGKTVGDGHCVAYVQAAANAPLTSLWIQGAPVWSADEIAPGTAIATFGTLGTYQNNTDGTSHAAIAIERTDDGIQVWDQWIDHPVSQRLIRFGNDSLPCDDGDAYSIIESAE